MESERPDVVASDATAASSFVADAKTLLARFCRGEMLEGQFRKSEGVVNQMIDNQLNSYFCNLEERVTHLIDERLYHHFDKIEQLILSKSCWMSPVRKMNL